MRKLSIALIAGIALAAMFGCQSVQVDTRRVVSVEATRVVTETISEDGTTVQVTRIVIEEVESDVPPTPTQNPTPAVALTPTPTLNLEGFPLGGVYSATTDIAWDGALHGPHVAMDEEMVLNVIISYTNTLTVSGDLPWVDVYGTIQDDGSFFARGEGTVAGFPSVAAALRGVIDENGLRATYTLGGPGGLPNNSPITYAISSDPPVPPLIVLAPTEVPPLDVQVEDFVEAQVAATLSADIDFLHDHLHPAVIERYGSAPCQEYLAGVVQPDFNIDINAVSGPDEWVYETDDRSTLVLDTYDVDANLTIQGQTERTSIHYGVIEGKIYWYTDCGVPLD
jgi:hypothetical protein